MYIVQRLFCNGAQASIALLKGLCTLLPECIAAKHEHTVLLELEENSKDKTLIGSVQELRSSLK
jgi:hypothetical protein